jgi:hypothetical protein
MSGQRPQLKANILMDANQLEAGGLMNTDAARGMRCRGIGRARDLFAQHVTGGRSTVIRSEEAPEEPEPVGIGLQRRPATEP